MTPEERTKRIRELNDNLRRTGEGGQIVATQGVAALPRDQKMKVLQAVRGFDEFAESNDPYGEHEFGSIEVDGLKVFFKIDYYDSEMKFGSEDPSDPTKTTRVLTIMLAEEY